MIKDFIHSQTVSWENVTPTMTSKFESRRGWVTYLNSSAGLISYTTKKENELAKFRNDAVNKFSLLVNERASQKQFLKLYKYILKNWDCSYKANANTRLKMLYVF